MTVILLRHGESSSNIARTLAGRSPGVELTDRGTAQAAAVTDRLVPLPIEHIATSPMARCRATVAPLAGKLALTPEVCDELNEVDYGDWTGQPLAELVDQPLWQVVQRHASGAVFPGGEGLAQMQHRAVAAIRGIDARLTGAGPDVLWVACTHGDVIKSVLADAFGIHLDGFQRITAEPASISVVRYGTHGPSVWRVNDTGSDLSGLAASTVAGPGGEVRDDDNGQATERHP